ncbi:hypothetical protein [Novosphingobium sp. CECT 9465]|uniref:hypothetical protein n=1 Tax=Novosphingobium sp. CECT 9465 TaxID=2829794 RepID=UPI001E5897FE|nr:hypothetical protein [Novosphingobium sp. CECT 9465]
MRSAEQQRIDRMQGNQSQADQADHSKCGQIGGHQRLAQSARQPVLTLSKQDKRNRGRSHEREGCAGHGRLVFPTPLVAPAVEKEIACRGSKLLLDVEDSRQAKYCEQGAEKYPSGRLLNRTLCTKCNPACDPASQNDGNVDGCCSKIEHEFSGIAGSDSSVFARLLQKRDGPIPAATQLVQIFTGDAPISLTLQNAKQGLRGLQVFFAPAMRKSALNQDIFHHA